MTQAPYEKADHFAGQHGDALVFWVDRVPGRPVKPGWYWSAQASDGNDDWRGPFSLSVYAWLDAKKNGAFAA